MSFFDALKRIFGQAPPGQQPSEPPALAGDMLYDVSLSADEAVGGTTVEVKLRNADGTLRETLAVKVPAGVRDGTKLRVPGKGPPGTTGNGDVYVVLKIAAAAPSASSGPPRKAPQAGNPPVSAPPGAAPVPRQPPKTRMLNLDASAFAPLAGSEIQSQLSGLGSDSWSIFRGMTDTDNRFWGNRSVIPPSSDPRTRFIDRGMVGQGMITPEELVEIHQVGDQMLEMRGELEDARNIAEQAVQRSKAERDAIKQQKKAEAAQRQKKHAQDVARRKATDIIYLGRGVSKGLCDRRANIEKLQAAGLPVLATPADVAMAMGLSIPRLRWLAFHSEAATRTHYVRFTVPKKSGGTRELAAPQRLIRSAQSWILLNILQKLKTHDAAHGFVTGRSTLTNARQHLNRAVVVNCDLKGFFPSITVYRVIGLFAELGYSKAAATILALICTESPRRVVDYAGTTFHVAAGPRCLPQGACTSPAISNLIARRLDSRLAGISRKLGFSYSRYADDLTFSAAVSASESLSAKDAPDNPDKKVGYILARCRHFAEDEGFVVNETKTRVQRPNSSQRVTGVVVNNATPTVPRKAIRRVRAILHNARKTGLTAQNTHGHPHFEAHVRGMISYIHMINPDQADKLRAALSLVVSTSGH